MINEVQRPVTIPQQIKTAVMNWKFSSSRGWWRVNQVPDATLRWSWSWRSELANNVSGHWRLTTDIAEQSSERPAASAWEPDRSIGRNRSPPPPHESPYEQSRGSTRRTPSTNNITHTVINHTQTMILCVNNKVNQLIGIRLYCSS